MHAVSVFMRSDGWANFKYLYGKYDKSDRKKTKCNEIEHGNIVQSIDSFFIVADRKWTNMKKMKQPFVSAHNIHIQIILNEEMMQQPQGTFKIILRWYWLDMAHEKLCNEIYNVYEFWGKESTLKTAFYWEKNMNKEIQHSRSFYRQNSKKFKFSKTKNPIFVEHLFWNFTCQQPNRPFRMCGKCVRLLILCLTLYERLQQVAIPVLWQRKAIKMCNKWIYMCFKIFIRLCGVFFMAIEMLLHRSSSSIIIGNNSNSHKSVHFFRSLLKNEETSLSK